MFTRDGGKPVRDFRGAWRNLCVRAGSGRLGLPEVREALWGECECGASGVSMPGLYPTTSGGRQPRLYDVSQVAPSSAAPINGRTMDTC